MKKLIIYLFIYLLFCLMYLHSICENCLFTIMPPLDGTFMEEKVLIKREMEKSLVAMLLTF